MENIRKRKATESLPDRTLLDNWITKRPTPKDRSTTAWVHLPTYDNAFTTSFHRDQQSHEPSLTEVPHSHDDIEGGTIAPTAASLNKRPDGVRRPQRQSSAIQYTTKMYYDDDSSESDIIARSQKTIVAKKQDSAYEFYGESSEDVSDNDEAVSSESDATESEEEVQVKRPPVRTQTQTSSAFARGKKTNKNMKKIFRKAGHPRGLVTDSPPLSEIPEIFQDLVQRATEHGLRDAVHDLEAKRLRVATMCSGTESPLLAVEMICDALANLGLKKLAIDHLFSAEIVPYKQAYIERNFHPQKIFRDIREFSNVIEDEVPMATTAFMGLAPIPMEIDILVAGTSCVDFSRLNSYNKSIDDEGESGETWRAMFAYCRRFRPIIVVLENVMNAEWDKMLETFVEIDYESAGVLVDSKDYYIPHTRQRGYMACFDKTKLGATKNVGHRWQSLMEQLKRPASSPINSFLLSNDQLRSRPQLQTDDQPTREVDWAQCELSQAEYRQEKRLGNARPYTNWQESGSILAHDSAAISWFPDQVERVLDTIDGCLLRKALPRKENGMFDARYKTRIWNLSQNIYRDEDNQPFGITGCITPSGIFFLSDAGRVLEPEETLMLQGLPLDRISFTTETHAELQDLAGNAMTATVVGAAIISALIAGRKIIGAPLITEAVTPESQQIRLNQSAKKIHVSTGSGQVAVKEVIKMAGQSLRRCFCEGASSLAERPIQECEECGHSTCIACGGNPPHRYRGHDSVDRLVPTKFVDYVMSNLPLALEIKPGVLNYPSSTDELYAQAAERCTNGTFTFRGTRRTHCWTITYQSTNARLDLVVTELRAEWRLYALPSKTLPVNSELRAILQQPIAKAVVVRSLLDVDWLWRAPVKKTVPLNIKCSSSQIASWWSRNLMPDFKDHAVPETLDIAVSLEDRKLANTINGTYKYLPHCGKACSSLFRKVVPEKMTEQHVFLFLDPTRIGSPDEDCFVFSTVPDDLEYDEVRPILARIKAPWRPWAHDKNPTKPSLIADDTWVMGNSSLQVVKPDTTMAHPTTMREFGHTPCYELSALVECQLSGTLSSGPNRQMVKSDDTKFFKDNAWIFQVIGRNLPKGYHAWHHLRPQETLECDSCAPKPPAVRWRQGEKDSIRPYEDRQSATHYERNIKSRPDAILVEVDRSSTGRTRMVLGLNVTTLAHRSVARLSRSIPGTLRKAIECSWRFSTESRADKFVFKKFKLRPTSNIEPYQANLEMSVQLFPKQRLVLAWMLQQEAGVEFIISNVEEERIQSLGWRVEVVAKFGMMIRGGICAAHPGFGKTITSLALIQAEYVNAGDSKRILAKLTGEQNQHSDINRLVPSAATLIICPQTLLKQWVSEIQEKLGSLKGVITINQTSHLLKYSIEDFKDAKIIVVNRSVLGSEAYAEKLAAFAAFPPPITTSGRRFSQWLKFATAQVPEHLEILQKGKAHFKNYVAQKYRENLASETFEAVIPSKRLRGAAFAAEVKKNAMAKSKPKPLASGAPSTVNTANIDMPLFQMYYFNRIIVDEFHQYEQREYASIVGLKAHSRWGLSATPAIGDFYDISQIAGLLGIPLPIGSDQRGIMRAKNRRDLRKEMTEFERFDMMREVPTTSMYERIHEMDQQFLDTFVRCDIMDFDQLKIQEHLVTVSLDLAHMTIYSELSQQLNSTSMRIKKTTKSKTKSSDRWLLFNEAIASSTTAEEALSKAAANLESLDISTIIKRRQAQLDGMMKKELPDAITKARNKEPHHFDKLRQRLSTDVIGDVETTETILNLIGGASIVSRSKSSSKTTKVATSEESGDGEVVEATNDKSRDSTAALNVLCNQVVIAKRSLRYFENVLALKEQESTRHLCDNSHNHGEDKDLCDGAVSAHCGHIVCKDCFLEMKSKGTNHCPAEGCSSTMSNHHLLWRSKMGSSARIPHGAKIHAAMKLLQKIQSHGDQAILFVQFQNQLDQVELALRDLRIPSTVVKTLNESAELIRDFRETSASSSSRKTVLVLNASDETAAGSNLQNANHVIFLSPLLRDSAYAYESTMAQAIGRVRRHGQKKDIHVYRIVALDTIDVDILEHRERRADALVELGEDGQGEHSVVAPEWIESSPEGEGQTMKKERTQLVKEDGRFSLRPRSWLVSSGKSGDGEVDRWKGKNRVLGWEDFSSLVKFSRAFTEDDD